MNKEKSEKKPTTRKRAPRSPKSVRLIVERHYIGNVPMNTLFQRLAEEEIRKTAESYLAAGYPVPSASLPTDLYLKQTLLKILK